MNPFGKATIKKEGADAGIISFSKMVGLTLDTVEVMAAKEVVNMLPIRPLDHKLRPRITNYPTIF